jgi:hypothetical protein
MQLFSRGFIISSGVVHLVQQSDAKTIKTMISSEHACDAAYLLFIDPTPKNSTGVKEEHASMLTNLLNSAARYLQPYPGVLHTELLFISKQGKCHHFATYIGDEANWQLSSPEYYQSQQWHAIPIAFGSDVNILIQECQKCVNAPYSILKYVVSTPILGWVSYLMTDKHKSSAHCGGLVARIIKNANSDMMSMPAPRYSPSDVYNAAKHRQARMPTPAVINHIHARHELEQMAHNPWLTMSDQDLISLPTEMRVGYMVEYARAMANNIEYGYTMKQTSLLGWIVVRAIAIANASSSHPVEAAATIDPELNGNGFDGFVNLSVQPDLELPVDEITPIEEQRHDAQ